MAHYFVDRDFFNEDDLLWHGDLGHEADIAETESESLESTIEDVLYYFKCGMFEEDYDVNETYVMFSIFEGVWNKEYEEWVCGNPYDRKDKIVFRIFSGSKEFANRYGIKADIYMGVSK